MRGQSERLTLAIQKRGYESAAEFARAIDVAEGTVRAQINRGSIPKSAAETYAKKLKLPVSWLLFGQGDDPFPADSHIPSEHIATPREIESAGASDEKGPRTIEFDGDAYAALVRFDLYASAGSGTVLPDVTEIRDRLLFKMDWLRSVTRAGLEEMACLTVIGDSMETALNNGDVVLIDMTQNNPARDDIYVIRRDGLLLVKRLKKSFKTKTLTIISDNPKYGAEEGVDPDDVQVIGRVFWMGRKM